MCAIKVVVKAFATVREALGQIGRASVELQEEATVKNLLDILLQKFGERMKAEVLEDDGTPKKSIKIFVNGRDIDFLNGLSTVLKDGDEVAIIPPIAGG